MILVVMTGYNVAVVYFRMRILMGLGYKVMRSEVM